MSPELSIVIPVQNESPNIKPLYDELTQTLGQYGRSYELLIVDDGSTDDTWSQIAAAPLVRGLRFAANLGQSAAIYYGLRAATQPLVGLMDGDGQNDPVDFARLVGALRESGADVVCGYRAHRHDTWQRRVVSRLGNGIRRAFLHDEARDTGCSQKVFRREQVELLVPFRGLHRYLPAIFRHAGLRVAEVAVNHRARLGGVSKYGNWHRALDGLFDLIGVSWLLDRKLLPPSMETK